MSVDIIGKIDQINVNKRDGQYAVYKPLLLLIILTEVRKGRANEFHFSDIYQRLTTLMEKHGWNTINKKKAEYPFHFLASSDLWVTNIDRSKLKHPDAPTKAELASAKGKLSDEVYSSLKANPSSIDEAIAFIERKFFGKEINID